MKLLDDFTYKDPSGKLWTALKGTKIDGASIPRILWSVIGSPFTGGYRDASVIHDYYCQSKIEPWEATHDMFYYACLAGGVSETKAKTMWSAVYAAGPRWKLVKSVTRSGSTVLVAVSRQPSCAQEDLEKVDQWIEKDNPSLADLKKKLDQIVKDQ
jgi:hypothetical protein